MSLLTTGVNGVPEVKRWIQFTRIRSNRLAPRFTWTWCRQSPEERASSTPMGLPAVLEKPLILSRTLLSVYATPQVNCEFTDSGESCSCSCRLTDEKSERSWVTRLNWGLSRPSPAAIAPVVGTMLEGWTNTGRLASSGRVNCCVALKLRSLMPVWFWLSEYVPVSVAMRRLSRTGRAHCSVDRMLDWAK